jgi:hypothetical protein
MVNRELGQYEQQNIVSITFVGLLRKLAYIGCSDVPLKFTAVPSEDSSTPAK